MSDLTNPLQAFIDKATELPKKTGATKPYADRINPRKCTDASLLFLDVSSSMNEMVVNFRKIDLLRQALCRPLSTHEIVIAFNSAVFRLPDLYSIPDPFGGTALHLALTEARPLKPRHNLVVSDGKPDAPDQCLAIAAKLSGVINTLYIGHETDSEAIAFMQKLARLGCGRSKVCDLRYLKQEQELAVTIAGLLPAV